MKLTEKMVSEDGVQYTKKIVEEPQKLARTSKNRQRVEIQDQVFDIHDAVADNAKWASILTTVMNRMWEVMPEDQKSQIDPSERALIDYAFSQFKATNTRADVQMSNEGPQQVVDKLLARQKKIGEIVK